LHPANVGATLGPLPAGHSQTKAPARELWAFVVYRLKECGGTSTDKVDVNLPNKWSDYAMAKTGKENGR
jgi:hypothetical protein